MESEAPRTADPRPVSGAVILLLSLACGIVVASIYYVQPLIGPISRDLGLSTARAGILVTVTQVGYAIGLVLIVPLGDIMENRRLLLALLAALVLALAATGAAPTAGVFLAASLVTGAMSSAVQVMVPFAGHLAADAERGRVVGQVVSGLLFGIMLARPAASFCAELFGDRSIFALSAVAIVVVALTLAARLPERRPHGMPYLRALASLGPLFAHTPVLHRRGTYHAMFFGCFSLFWTAVPLLLEGPRFGFTQGGIGLFALVGAGGALVSPAAGRAADAGHGHRVTSLAFAGAIGALLLAAGGGASGSWPLLVVAAVVLDVAVAAHLVIGQRDIFALDAEARGRLNGLYLAMFFVGGALGSYVAGLAYAGGGWLGTCLAGLAFLLVGLGYYLTDRGPRPGAGGEQRG